VRAKDHAGERAALFLALVAGVQMMRQMIGLAALANAKPSTLASLLKPVIDTLMNDTKGWR
jgi:Tetracyclin repressor-like, C-terminal domain